MSVLPARLLVYYLHAVPMEARWQIFGLVPLWPHRLWEGRGLSLALCGHWPASEISEQNPTEVKLQILREEPNPWDLHQKCKNRTQEKPTASQDGGGYQALPPRTAGWHTLLHLGPITEKQALSTPWPPHRRRRRTPIPWILTFLGKLTLLTWLTPHPLPAQIYLCFVSGGKTDTHNKEHQQILARTTEKSFRRDTNTQVYGKFCVLDS